MKQKNELQKYLDHAFDMLSYVSVKGDDIERMAEARETLRRAYKMAEEKQEGDGKDG